MTDESHRAETSRRSLSEQEPDTPILRRGPRGSDWSSDCFPNEGRFRPEQLPDERAFNIPLCEKRIENE